MSDQREKWWKMSEQENDHSEANTLRVFLGSVAQVVTISAILSGGLWWISTQIHSVDKRLTTLELSSTSRWTAVDMHAWSQELGRANPTLAVPDARDIIQLRTYDSQRR
jgi:hypothetical protein